MNTNRVIDSIKPIEMNLILIISVVLMLPIAYGAKELIRERRRRRSLRVLRNAYDRLVREHKLSVEQSELFNRKVIGLDRRNKKLLLVDHTNSGTQEVCIHLPEIAGCTIKQLRDDYAKAVKKIMLELHHKRSDKQLSLCFYDAAHDHITEMPFLLRKAKYWKHRIDLHKHSGNVHSEFEYVL